VVTVAGPVMGLSMQRLATQETTSTLLLKSTTMAKSEVYSIKRIHSLNAVLRGEIFSSTRFIAQKNVIATFSRQISKAAQAHYIALECVESGNGKWMDRIA
jgi:hypothetical protein